MDENAGKWTYVCCGFVDACFCHRTFNVYTSAARSKLSATCSFWSTGAAQRSPSVHMKELPDVTLFEASCRLVGLQQANIANVSHLLYPIIIMDLGVIDSALTQHVPCLEVRGNLKESPDNDISGSQQSDQAPGWQQLPLWLLSAARREVLSRLPGPWHALSHGAPILQLMAWHSKQPLLALGHSRSGAVLVYDCASKLASTAATASDPTTDPLTQPQHVLVHQLQQHVSCIAWRRVHSSMCAVGCSGGVALWSVGKPRVSAAAWSRGLDASPSTPAAWVSFLPFKTNCRVSSLAWSPDGMLLAGSSLDSNRLMVWDVALGVGSKLRLGVVPVHLLSWSPDGSYLFAADRSGQFFLFETTTWTMRQWVSPPGAYVSGAAWAPDSSVLLLSSTGSNFLVGLHIVGQPTNMNEQLLPVTLPGISDKDLTLDSSKATRGPQHPPAQTSISSMVWDPTGNRLAVVLQAPHPAAGSVALYSTTFTPVVTCNLIGFVEPGSAADVDSYWRHGDGNGSSSSSRDVPGKVPGSSDSRLQATFAHVSGKPEAAGLLSIGQIGSTDELCRVVNIPLYY